jgi:hypothetical protein
MIEIKRISVSRVLTKAAICLWFVSLALPGFSVEHTSEPIYGIFILFAGILFGWAVNGWAAYANIFFLVIAFKLLRDADSIPIGLSIAMVALATTIPMFNGIIQSEGTMATVPVVSWGWGAILWLMSVGVLATATACRAGHLSESILKTAPLLLVALLISVGAYRMHQWDIANDQEREMYLPKSMALSVANFCGVPFVWPAGPVVEAGGVVAVDIDGGLRSDVPPYMPIKLPEFLHYERFGYDWEKYELADLPSITVRSESQPKNIVLQVKTTSEGGVIRILNRATKSVLYEQPLRLGVAKDGRKRVCPLSGSDQWSGLSRGHYDALKVALGPVIKSTGTSDALGNAGERKIQTKLLSEEAKPCGGSVQYFDYKNAERDLDGRRVVFDRDVRNLSPFCSPSYVGLIFVRSGPAGAPDRLNSDVYLYDRQTLQPLASFNDRGGCLVSGRCSGFVPPENINGLRIEDDRVTVNTAEGVAVAKRRY